MIYSESAEIIGTGVRVSWSRSVPPWTCATNFLYRAHGATTIERQSCNDPAGRLRVP